MRKANGISLIVLVITIIVMIMLATSIILSISNSGLIGKANEGTFKNDLKVAQEELQIYIQNQILNDPSYDSTALYANADMLEYNGVKVEKQNIETVIPSLKSYLKRKVRVTKGQLEYRGDRNDDNGIPLDDEDNNYKNWAIDIGVKAKLQSGYDYTKKKLLSSDYALSFVNGTTLEIPESPVVKIIGEDAYYNVPGLTSVKLSKDVVTIEKNVFRGNTSLTSVDFRAGMLGGGSLVTIGANAFLGCSKLVELNLPSTLTVINSSAFQSCSSLKNVVLPDSVTTVGSYAFNACSSLESVTLPKNIKTIDMYTFNNCKKLKTINWPENVASNTLVIKEGAFVGCSSLSGKLVIPEGVTSIAYNAFANCTGITEVVLPSTLKTLGTAAFSGCTNLTKINIPSSVTSLGYNVFSGCKNLTDITYEGNNYVVENGIMYNSAKTKISTVLNAPTGTVTIPATVTSIDAGTLRTIMQTATVEFEDGNTKYMIDNGSIYIKENGNPVNLVVYNGTGTTYNAPSTLKEITAYAFSVKGSNLTSVNISSSSVTKLVGYSFSGCSKLTTLSLNNGITAIDDYALHGLSKLTSLTLPSSLKSLTSYVLYGCSSLKTIDVSSNVTGLYFKFFYNSGVTTVNFASGSKYKQQGNYIMTADGKQLIWMLGNSAANVSIPNGVETISDYAFRYKTAIVTVSLPTTLKTIGGRAFEGCSKLQSISIPDSITSIGPGVFASCTSLTRISIDREEGTIKNAPWEAPYGLRIIEWKY